LREKLKIAVHIIHGLNTDYDEKELLHQLNAVDYDQWIEEINE